MILYEKKGDALSFYKFYVERVETPACSAHHFKGNEIFYLLGMFKKKSKGTGFWEDRKVRKI